jgi:hypothetical protein
MFYLEANNAQGEKISLYIQGIRLNGQLGICDGQKIFKLNKIYPELTHRILPDQIGITERINGKLFFNFTDAFKAEINYKDGQGTSTLDNSYWGFKLPGQIHVQQTETILYLHANLPIHDLSKHRFSLFSLSALESSHNAPTLEVEEPPY